MNSASPLHFSPRDSARFNMRIFRASLPLLDVDVLRSAFDSGELDIAIVRIPANHLVDLHSLHAAGLTAIVADTLVSHDVKLALHGAGEAAPNPVRLVRADANDKARLDRMAHQIFEGYVSHYHANPCFARPAIIDGYADWAANHADSGIGRGAWIVESNGVEVGFSCYRIDADGLRAHGVLNGILPTARRNGAYRNMLRAMLRTFADDGMSAFEISTQVHNIVVQRVWADLGLRLCGAETTLHISRGH